MEKTTGISTKITFQRLILNILKSLSREEIEEIHLMSNLDGNEHFINLYTSTILCNIRVQPTELELALFRYGVHLDIECDVVLRDALLFDVKSGSNVIRGSGKAVLSDNYHPGIETYIVRDDDIVCRNNDVKVPSKIVEVTSGKKKVNNLIDFMSLKYFSNFNKAYDCRLRSFIRIAAKSGELKIYYNNVMISVNGNLSYKIYGRSPNDFGPTEKLFTAKIKKIMGAI